jgi:hypothetical protein
MDEVSDVHRCLENPKIKDLNVHPSDEAVALSLRHAKRSSNDGIGWMNERYILSG